MKPFLASIHVYPVKSLGGFAMDTARLTDRGLEHDRRWMLVDETGRFLSQRELPGMARLHCAHGGDGFRVTDTRDGSALDLPWALPEGERHQVRVWDDEVHVLVAGEAWNTWFSERLGRAVRLVHMPDDAIRPADERFAQGIISLSDGFPYLVISQASLDDLNGRIAMNGSAGDLPMDRFRPNLVIGGGTAYQEDALTDILIGGHRFYLVKPCTRCAITTTDQRTGERGKEPLRTLATYRRHGDGLLFGMNATGPAAGTISIGDPVGKP